MSETDSSTSPDDADAIQRTADSLRACRVAVVVVENGEEATRKIIDMLPEGAEVFKSTSETLDSIGFSDYLRQSTRYNNLYNAVSNETDAAKQREMRRQVTVAEYYIGSVQGNIPGRTNTMPLEIFAATQVGDDRRAIAYVVVLVVASLLVVFAASRLEPERRPR